MSETGKEKLKVIAEKYRNEISKTSSVIEEIYLKIKDKEQPDKIRKFFCKFCGKEVKPNEEKCEECSTRLEKKDRENREVDEFIASLAEK